VETRRDLFTIQVASFFLSANRQLGDIGRDLPRLVFV
jgi:hypothetical protein